MSIQTRCPSCDTSYNLAESQRGKKVQCRKCSNKFTVGEDNKKAPATASAAKSGKIPKSALQTSPVPPPLTPPPKTKPAVVRRDRDRDLDDDEEDDRLARREPRTKKGGLSTPVILLIVGGVLIVVLLGIGLTVGAFYLWKKQAENTAAGNLGDAIQNAGATNGGDPNNPGGMGGQPVGPDQPTDVNDAMIWIQTAQTADKQNKAAEWLSTATVNEAQRPTVAKLLENLAANGNTHNSAVKGLAQWAGPENVPTLLREADADSNWRAGGPSKELAAALVRLKAAAAVPIFAKRLPTNPAVAKQMLADLCATGDPKIISAVETDALKYFDSPNNVAHTDAIDLLRVACGTKPEKMFDQAVADLRSRETGYARTAADYIAKQPVNADRQAEVAKELEGALGGDGETRTAAASALAAWATKDNVPTLIDELDHADTFGNGDFPAILDALVRLKDERGAEAVAKHLKNGFQRAKVYAALRVMGKVAEKAVAVYVTDGDAEVADAAKKLIKQYGSGGDVELDAMLMGLSAADGKQRRTACDELAKMPVVPARQPEVARALEKLIDDKDDFFNQVPAAAIKALAVWGDDKTGTALVIAMQKPNSRVWQECVDALVARKDEQAVLPLFKYVVSGDISHKDAAVKALNDLGPVLETGLDDALTNPAATADTKLTICAYLNKAVGTKASLPALQAAAMDTNAQVKNAAKGAIAAINKRNP